MWMYFLNFTSEIAVRCVLPVLAVWSKLFRLCTILYLLCMTVDCDKKRQNKHLVRREAKLYPVKQLHSLNLFSSLKWRNSVWLWTEAAFNTKKEGIDKETRRKNIQWTELLTRFHDARKYKISLLHGPLDGVIPIESGDEIAINPLNSNLKGFIFP